MSVIQNLRDNSARGTTHRWRDTSINSLDSLAQDEPLLGMSEQENHFGVDPEVGEGAVERMFHLPLHYRDGSDFLFANVIESSHGLQGGL